MKRRAAYLLDTSVYSQQLRPQPNPHIMDQWSALGDDALATSAICEAEVLYGLNKQDSKRLWTEYREYLENQIQILPVDKAVADQFATLKNTLLASGSPRGDFDLLIAATAIVHNLTLVTLNLKHFEGIPGLRVENWTK